MVNSHNKSPSADGIKLEEDLDSDSAPPKEDFRRGERSFSSESAADFDLSSDLTRSDAYSSEESKDESPLGGDSCSSRRRISRLTKRLSSSRTSYGLRPREELRKPSYDFDFDEKDPLEEVTAPLSSSRRTPHRRQGGRNNLQSKYRRKTANARERHRMKEINDAFTTLRGILPPMSSRKAAQVSMTKIRILRYATSYIEALSELLTEADSGIKGATTLGSPYTEPFFAGLQFRPTEDRFAPKKEEPDIERTKGSSEGGDRDPPNNSGAEREFTSCEGDIIAFLEGAANINESFNATLEELYFSLS